MPLATRPEPQKPSAWTLLITAPWDLLLWILGLALLWVLVTGGGVYHVAGLRISLHHVDKLVPAVVLLWWLRWRLTRRRPAWGIKAWTPDRLAESLQVGLQVVTDWLTTRPQFAALLVLALLAFGLRLLMAVEHPGFLTGDDVEVHYISLSRLWDRPHIAWDLRNAFYPLVFVMPFQWLVADDPARAVLAGRLVVVLYGASSVLLLAAVARRLGDGAVVVLTAAGLLASAKLAVVLGGSVLPRGVTMFWVLLGFWALLDRSGRGIVPAALALAVAATLRFSEAIFLVPAVVQLMLERRWRHLFGLILAWNLATGLMLGLTDWFYRGEAFSSLLAIVRFTLIEGDSTRGFQPAWHYLTEIPHWTSLAVAVLAVLGWRRARWRPYLWLIAPMILLSLLPHKEARYLLPCLPFLCLAAAHGVDDLLRRVTPSRAVWLAPLLLAVPLLEIDGYRHQRSDGEVDLARHIAAERSAGEGVLFEWGWRAGGWIYLRDVDVLHLPDLLEHAPRDKVLAALDRDGLHWLAISGGTMDRQRLEPELERRGYREIPPPTVDPWGGYRLWRRTSTD